MGQFVVDRGSQVSKVEDLAMARCERGHCPPYICELWDAATGGRSISVSVVDHRGKHSGVDYLAFVESECERWPIDVRELRVPMEDAVTRGRSVGKSVKCARRCRLIVNKESARLSPTWRANCWCFVNWQVNLYVCHAALGRRW